jgi:hypothetical protein
MQQQQQQQQVQLAGLISNSRLTQEVLCATRLES